MSKNRFAIPVAVLLGFAFLFAVPGMIRADSTPKGAVQTPKVTSAGTRQKSDALPPDDFAGLSYTDERDTESHRQAVINDNKLTADQKDAMLLGYTRMEYGLRFKVLSPEQKRQVRQRMQARRAADQTAQKKQSQQPRN